MRRHRIDDGFTRTAFSVLHYSRTPKGLPTRSGPDRKSLGNYSLSIGGVAEASVAACAACFSLRAMFRVCHDLPSVFGFGFSFLRDSRVCGVLAMHPLSGLFVRHAGVREVPTV